MGCSAIKKCKIDKSFTLSPITNENKQISFKYRSPQLDLNYRHYITKNQYIPSRPPHYLFKFNGKLTHVNKSIMSSTIMLRRLQEAEERLVSNNKEYIKTSQETKLETPLC